jgi:hypothetical protein
MTSSTVNAAIFRIELEGGIMIWPHSQLTRLRQFVLSAAIVLLTTFALVSGADAQTNPYASRVLSSTFGTCIGVNSGGDVFYVGTSATTTTYIPDGLYEMTAVNGAIPNNPTVTKITTGLINVNCVAVDGRGNVFVMGGSAQNPDTINELVAVNGALPTNPAIRTIVTGVSFFTTQITADGNGDIFFITDTNTGDGGSEYINEIAAVNGAIPDNPAVLTLVTRTDSASSGVMLNLTINTPKADTNGDLYYIDDGRVMELPAVSGSTLVGVAPRDVVDILGANGTINGIAVDGNGDLFLGDYISNSDGTTTSEILKAVPINGMIPTSPALTTAYSASIDQFEPRDMTADSHGNVFLTNVRVDVTENILELSPATSGTLTIAPVMQSFPATPMGGTSLSQDSVITNGTAQAVYISPGTLTDATDFDASNNCDGIIAANGGHCNVTFIFTPQKTGALSSTYSIHDLNTPNSPFTVVLSGNGTATTAQAVLTPASFDFGNVAPGATSATQTFTLSNPGSAALSINSITITGANASSFAITSNGCAIAHIFAVPGHASAQVRAKAYDFPQLPPDISCTITVTFAPTAAGNASAALSVSDSAGTQTSTLTGAATGAAPPSAPQAALTPPNANFGSVTSSGSSTPQTITLTNAGTAILPITSVSITGANASSFKLGANSCGTSLVAGGTCTVPVTFVPANTGNLTATLAIVDSVGTQISVLSGTGTASTVTADFIITATPSTQSAYLGTSVTYSVFVNSASAASPLTNAVALSATGLPAGASVSFSPAAVVPGTTQPTPSTMTVTVPQLSSRNTPFTPHPFGGLPADASLASLGVAWLCSKRKRLAFRNIALVCSGLVVMTMALTGCSGSSTGFATPVSTSTITVTGTSGSTVHSTTVTLTVK